MDRHPLHGAALYLVLYDSRDLQNFQACMITSSFSQINVHVLNTTCMYTLTYLVTVDQLCVFHYHFADENIVCNSHFPLDRLCETCILILWGAFARLELDY